MPNFALFLLLFTATQAWSEELNLKPLRPSVFKKLFSEKYFKNASCREFADYNLTQNGLPKIGETNPVKGSRLSTDRQNELANPPQFLDSVMASENPYKSYKISGASPAGTGSKNSWVVTIDREMDVQGTKNSRRRLKTQTIYRFKILDYNNVGSCAVESFDFQAIQDGDHAPVKKSMDLGSCMDLFFQGAVSEKSFSPSEKKMLSLLREDCSIGMHYSLEAKKILSQPVH